MGLVGTVTGRQKKALVLLFTSTLFILLNDLRYLKDSLRSLRIPGERLASLPDEWQHNCIFPGSNFLTSWYLSLSPTEGTAYHQIIMLILSWFLQ